jgi:hypothetical protein
MRSFWRATRRALARVWRWVRIPLLLLGIALIIPLIGIAVQCDPFERVEPVRSPGTEIAASFGISEADYVRPEDQTYVTFPEWYIVFSADEYAAFIQENKPSGFPYFGSIAQYWRSYREICAVTRNQYTFNTGYHVVLYVIGVSFTAENFAKGVYEGTIGRLSEWLSTDALTEEDAYAREVAAEYGSFLHMIPWYEFPFGERLRGLWATTSLWGPNPIRKWERKFYLSMEYGGKAVYGRLIRGGTEATYEPDEVELFAITEGIDEDVLAQNPRVSILESFEDGRALTVIPRFQGFTDVVPGLVRQGVSFVEIAGNNEIMLTAFAPRDWVYDLPQGRFLFAMEYLTDPSLNRIAVTMPVEELDEVLLGLEERGVRLEHIFDY